MIFVARVRLMKSPLFPHTEERRITLLKHEGFSTWAEALEDVTEFDATAFKCWSVTVGADQPEHTYLMLFDKPTSHPHYSNATA